MDIEAIEKMEPLFAASFFSLEGSLLYTAKTLKSDKKYLLPDMSDLLEEDSFCRLYAAWSDAFLLFRYESDVPFQGSFYPKFTQGDALELFIDTRILKTSGFLTKFCHHFVILPEVTNGVRAQEITHLRPDDGRALIDGTLIFVETTFEKEGFFMDIKIPIETLFGFDRALFPKIGFSFRAHRVKGKEQNFSAALRSSALERQSVLWGTFDLIKE